MAQVHSELSMLLWILFSLGYAQDYCTTETSGRLQGLRVSLTPIRLSPGSADWNITVPLNWNITVNTADDGEVVGVVATVCDRAASPALRVLPGGTVRVWRSRSTGWGLALINIYYDPKTNDTVKNFIPPPIQLQRNNLKPVQTLL